jgi:hypothetical protein
MAISTLCLAAILSNILTFNFTVICMAGTAPDNLTNATGWYKGQQSCVSLILSSS